MKTRTNIIFCGFNSFLWATAGIAITVHSNNAASCAVNSDLQKTYGDDYTAAWATQVRNSIVVYFITNIFCS